MRLFWMFVLSLSSHAAFAGPVADVARTADAAFGQMPQVVYVSEMAGQCGADRNVHSQVAFCTSQNVIFVTRDRAKPAELAYLVAHAYGHAVQVRHGVADVALRAIRSRRAEEATLRGYVERQVDCIAGYLSARAGLARLDIGATFENDPLDVPHWGRDPLHRGPHLEVPPDARAEWFLTGFDEGLSACAVGEFPATLLIDARRP